MAANNIPVDWIWQDTQEFVEFQRICYFKFVATFLATVVSDGGQEVA